MPIFKRSIIGIAADLALASCGGKGPSTTGSTPSAMKDVPAVRLNFRYEGDVPAPTIDQQNTSDQRNQGVQADFDGARPQDEILDRTVASPNAQSVLAVWHRAGDSDGEFRLDMYDAGGRLLKKVTADTMSAKFP